MPLLVSKLPKKEVMKSSELGKDVIRKELPLIPKSPGVYRMLDHKDVILYVGKAKNLPNRLKSYVAEKNHMGEVAIHVAQCGQEIKTEVIPKP